MGCTVSANTDTVNNGDRCVETAYNNKGLSRSNPHHPNPAMYHKSMEVIDPNEVKKTKAIDRLLDQERQKNHGKVKLLLLGAGESGKSTIFKQMRILHGEPLDDDELRFYGVIVRSNIVVAMRKLCLHLNNLGLEAKLSNEKRPINMISSSKKEYFDVGGVASKASGMTPKEAYDEILYYLVDNLVDSSSSNKGFDPNMTSIEPIDPNDWVGHCPRAGASANKDASLFLQHSIAIYTLWKVKTKMKSILLSKGSLLRLFVFIPLTSIAIVSAMDHTTSKSQTMKVVWSKRANVNVIDSHREFLNDIWRIASPKYKPTMQDTLLARVKTSRVQTERYRIEGIEFEVYDVGGQRSERRKWIDCFDTVDAVIFVAALCEYDQCLAETRDRTIHSAAGGGRHIVRGANTNRMVETLNLFRSVVNNRAFVNKPIVLFLNKKDVFAEKVLYSPIHAQPAFADYDGLENDFDDGVQYFLQKFRDCLEDEQRIHGQNKFHDNFIHVTNATDTNNMEFVLDASRSIIVTQNLINSGFISWPDED